MTVATLSWRIGDREIAVDYDIIGGVAVVEPTDEWWALLPDERAMLRDECLNDYRERMNE